ncbi:hypothetical protein M501DRAFT_917630, partial [Patellaria atrata CBS 101060]
MVTRKRNEFLEAESSEDEDQGYDSEAAEESRGTALAGRAPKRQKTESGDDSDALSDSGEQVDGQDDIIKPGTKAKSKSKSQRTTKKPQTSDLRFAHFPPESLSPEPEAPEHDDNGADDALSTSKKQSATKKSKHRSGVIYLSRIPPFMKPTTLRTLLTPHGALNRIFLTPEPAISHRQRTSRGGNKKTLYLDGWVEFVSKRDAKACAATLNAQPIGGKKGGYYYDDVWNMKYLKGFKWRHLTEQIANENAERAARMRAEVSRARREDREFVRNVERGKVVETKERKKRARR